MEQREVTDPILDAHKVLPGFYRISGGSTPISIRDQMVRGWLVTERLRQNGLINDKSPLLVIGAGAGGATAAIWAARNKIRTVLIEKSETSFDLQKRAPTRFLDPNQYDWPTDHWTMNAFPWDDRGQQPMPLSFTADYSHRLAAAWESEFNASLSGFGGGLDYFNMTTATSIDTIPDGPNLCVTFQGNRNGPEAFGAVIWAAGAGREECRLFQDGDDKTPIYEGRPFWSRDPFTEPNCGVEDKEARVLISGTGDGGLQDFLRIVTKCESAGELYRKLGIPQDIEARIQSAEDRAHRGRIWVDEDPAHRATQEDPFLKELHGEHQFAVDDALAHQAVGRSLKLLFPHAPSRTLLIGYKPYLTGYYALNRFLVLLLSSYIQRRFYLETLRMSTSITDVTSVGAGHHACMINTGVEWTPAGGYAQPDCHGRDHEVTLRNGLGPKTSEVFNVIVVRHGTRAKSSPIPPLAGKSKAMMTLSRPRHLLPYHLPA